jgi:hypothetical protein
MLTCCSAGYTITLVLLLLLLLLQDDRERAAEAGPKLAHLLLDLAAKVRH